jgi:hypothetical protein
VGLDGNRFAVLERESVSVACIMYGGPQRHFVEIKLANRSGSPLLLDRRFVTIDAGDFPTSGELPFIPEQHRQAKKTRAPIYRRSIP